MHYTYRVGQIVRAKSMIRERPQVILYQITRLLPPEADEIPCYRVRNVSDGVEWVVAQNRIEPA